MQPRIEQKWALTLIIRRKFSKYNNECIVIFPIHVHYSATCALIPKYFNHDGEHSKITTKVEEGTNRKKKQKK